MGSARLSEAVLLAQPPRLHPCLCTPNSDTPQMLSPLETSVSPGRRSRGHAREMRGGLGSGSSRRDRDGCDSVNATLPPGIPGASSVRPTSEGVRVLDPFSGATRRRSCGPGRKKTRMPQICKRTFSVGGDPRGGSGVGEREEGMLQSWRRQPMHSSLADTLWPSYLLAEGSWLSGRPTSSVLSTCPADLSTPLVVCPLEAPMAPCNKGLRTRDRYVRRP